MDFPFPTSFSSFSRDSPHKNIFHEGIYSNISIKHNNFNNPIPPFSSSKDTPTKTVYDPIHGYIKFPDLMWQIIDTPNSSVSETSNNLPPSRSSTQEVTTLDSSIA